MNENNYSYCIVSYAKYMEKLKLGRKIEKYDKIVRINNGINVVDKKFFGKTTDIFAGSFCIGKNILIIKTYNYIHKTNYSNIFDIISKNNVKEILICNTKKYDEIKNLKNINIITQKINKKLGLTTGLQAIINIISLKPKKLYICGFDFTTNLATSYDNFYKMFQTKKANTRLNKNYDDDITSKHSTIFEKYILKKLWEKYNFDVDPILKNILDDFNSNALDDYKFKHGKFIDIFNKIINYIS